MNSSSHAPNSIILDKNLDYTHTEIDKLTQLYEQELPKNVQRKIVKGRVAKITPTEAILHLGLKSDAVIHLSDFRKKGTVEAGDEVEVYVEKQEDKEGHLLASYSKAQVIKGWQQIEEAYKNKEPVNSTAIMKTRGGLIVNISGVEAFLPGSQVSIKSTVEEFDNYIGQQLPVMILKINHSKANVVVSHKAIIKEARAKQRKEIIENLKEGQVISGRVKNTTPFGVFIEMVTGNGDDSSSTSNIGSDIVGLAYVSDLSWGRIDHPDEIKDDEGNPFFQIGKMVKVVVIGFDKEKGHISLATKPFFPNPWDQVKETLAVGQKVKGRIKNVQDYGAFVEIGKNIEAFLHVSDFSHSRYVSKKSLQVGDEIEAMILEINYENQNIRIGVKQLHPNPWEAEDISIRYALNTKHKGIIRRFNNEGAFIELEPGIEGFVPNNHLSWVRKVRHAKDVIEKDADQEVVVLAIDPTTQYLQLGIRELEESPWEKFEELFKPGSIHQGKILKNVARGSIVELPVELPKGMSKRLQAFVQNKEIIKKDKRTPEENEVIDLVVRNFFRDEHRIILSHTATYQEDIKSIKEQAGEAVKLIQKPIKPTTLGDLDSLSQLREEMIKQEKK